MRLSAIKTAFCCWPFCNLMGAAVGARRSRADQSGLRTLAESINPESQWREGHEDVDVRHGVLFQVGVASLCCTRLYRRTQSLSCEGTFEPLSRATSGCPQAITAAGAKLIGANVTLPGNTITLQSQTPGRTGNHFEDLSQYFSMAYCCRSSLFVLPQKDDKLPTEDERTWKSTHRWYDFSDAKMDLLPEFTGLSERPDVCLPSRVESGLSAYSLIGVHPDLLGCLNHVFVRGCEAEYLGSVVNTTEFCRPRVSQTGTTSTEELRTEDVSTEDSHQRRLRKNKPWIHGFQPPTALDNNPEVTGHIGSGQSAGSLVIHIRSGDIFNPKGEGGKREKFDQPPLQFFLDAIGSKAWSDVTTLTSWTNPKETNPTYGALGLLKDAGILGPNVTLYHDRPLLDDLRAILCADALAVARSSMHVLTFAHTTASTFYLPDSCGPGTYTRQTRLPKAGLPKRSPDNATLLILEKPGAEVYGIEWGESQHRSYTPYENWSDSDKQLLEMVTFDGIKGLKRCSITD